MNEAMMVPIVLIIIVAVYAIIVKRRPIDEREVLYHKIMEKGCENCGSDFTDTWPRKPEDVKCMFLECKFCLKLYKVDHSLQWAWRL